MKKKESIRDFTEGKFLPQLLMLAIPIAATQLLHLIFNTADTLVVGRWGGDTVDECETALAAVGSCGSLVSLVVGLFAGLASGAGVVMAYAIGAKEENRIHDIVQTSFVLSVISGVAVSVTGILFPEFMLRAIRVDPAVIPAATGYLRAYFAGMFFNMIYTFCSALLRAMGDTVRPMIFLSIGGVVNVGLNLFMVIVLRLGALGVGIATAISYVISATLTVIWCARLEGPAKLNPLDWRVKGKVLGKILAIGVPTGLQGCVFSFSNVTIQSSVNALGKSVMAGRAAGANLAGYVYHAGNAFYESTLTFGGQCYGARKWKRMTSCLRTCLISQFVVMMVGSAIVCAFRKPLLELFTPGNEAALAAGGVYVLVVAGPYFLCGVMEIMSGGVRVLGKSTVSTVVSVIGSCALRIVWVECVYKPFFLGNFTVLVLCYPISWFVTIAGHTACFFLFLKREKEKHPEPVTE